MIVFAGNVIDSTDDDYYSYELFTLDLDTGKVNKLVETESEEYGIWGVFFNKTGDKVFYFKEIRFSVLDLNQLNVYDIEKKENKNISELTNFEEVNKEENLAYGYQVYLTDGLDFGYTGYVRNIVVDMEKDTIEPYDTNNDELLYIAGYYVPVHKGYIDDEDVLIYLSPDRKKALYLKHDECIKLLILDN